MYQKNIITHTKITLHFRIYPPTWKNQQTQPQRGQRCLYYFSTSQILSCLYYFSTSQILSGFSFFFFFFFFFSVTTFSIFLVFPQTLDCLPYPILSDCFVNSSQSIREEEAKVIFGKNVWWVLSSNLVLCLFGCREKKRKKNRDIDAWKV
jgi:hypothetical protein